MSCEASLENGKWSFDLPPSFDFSLAYEYAICSCDIQLAVFLCKKNSQEIAKIYGYLKSDSPVAPFELFRTLLDDELLPINDAVRIVTRCFSNISYDININLLAVLQPRTAALISIFKEYTISNPVAQHISNDDFYRSPCGAVATDTNIKFHVATLSKEIASVDFVLSNHSSSPIFYPMLKGPTGYSLIWNTGTSPMAYWYSFRLSTSKGFLWLIPDASGSHGVLSTDISSEFRLTVYQKGFITPDWLKNAVCYQKFPDRFCRMNLDTIRFGISYHKTLGQKIEFHENLDEQIKYKASDGESVYVPNDFYGGTLEGILKNIQYFKDLGINVIYLNPIVEASSNHRYDTANYENVDPILGTVADFQHFCKAFESQGIHIILDGVFSHTGADSIYFNRYHHYPTVGAFQSKDSQYFSWYKFKEFPNLYKSWWGFYDLPEVNKNNASWQNYIIHDKNSIIKLWLRRGASGWRIDVADEIPDEILFEFRKSSKAEKSDAALIGEVWEDAVTKVSYGKQRKYALGTSLDSVMNYPLRAEILRFLHNNIDAEQLSCFLESQRDNYPPEMYNCLMNLMSSHDVERLRTNLAINEDTNQWPISKRAHYTLTTTELQTASDLEKIAAAIQFSLPGMPSIYYGDEVGMSGCRDPFNRGYYKPGLKSPIEYYKKLSSLRHNYISLGTGSASFGFFGKDVLIILRHAKEELAVILINRSKKTYFYPLRKILTNMMTGEKVSGTLLIPATTAVFLLNQKVHNLE